MGNWVFLLLLYILFGWMKKKQQVKARKEIEDQEDWDKDTTPVSGFGVLDEFLKGQGLIDKDQRPGESVPKDENVYLDSRLDLPIDEAIDAGSNDDLDRLDQLETISEEIESFEDNILKTKSFLAPGSQHKYSKHRAINAVRLLSNASTLKDAIIIKEILDKPRSLRHRIR